TGKNPLKRVSASSEDVAVVRGGRQRKQHKAFLRYHDPKNWPVLREALNAMGRADLVGDGKQPLLPAWQPEGVKLGYPRSPAAGPPQGMAARGASRKPRNSQ
ncbi:MAG: DUF3362 domain-containing protein, partial [Rhodocyclaceae bacterium]|nr:DUF3362 domain-containing protein [Rhodocyclaceae bacterium]